MFKSKFRKHGKNTRSLSFRIKNYYLQQQNPRMQDRLTEVLLSSPENLHLRGSKQKKMKHRGLYDLQFVIEEGSLEKELLQYLHFVNIVYIALSCPLYTGFDIRVQGLFMALELISHAISFLTFCTNFMTPVVNELGEKTLDFVD